MTREPFRRVVGKCYQCREPIRAGDNAYVKDVKVGVDRLVHRACYADLNTRIGPRS